MRNHDWSRSSWCPAGGRSGEAGRSRRGLPSAAARIRSTAAAAEISGTVERRSPHRTSPVRWVVGPGWTSAVNRLETKASLPQPRRPPTARRSGSAGPPGSTPVSGRRRPRHGRRLRGPDVPAAPGWRRCWPPTRLGRATRTPPSVRTARLRPDVETLGAFPSLRTCR